jgi:predicted extracellular nuclease
MSITLKVIIEYSEDIILNYVYGCKKMFQILNMARRESTCNSNPFTITDQVPVLTQADVSEELESSTKLNITGNYQTRSGSPALIQRELRSDVSNIKNYFTGSSQSEQVCKK